MSHERIAGLRSILFVPGDRPDRFHKALASAADGVIIDLEDAVAVAAKVDARAKLERWMAANAAARFLVRINPAGTAEHAGDLAACRAVQVLAVVLPKAETADQVEAAHAASGKPVLPIIESARGLADAGPIAAAAGAARMCLGTIDLALDLALDTTSPGAAIFMDHARFAVAVASRLAGIAPPVDGVHTAIDDAEGLDRMARHASGFGFTGMLAIHPKQAAAINAAFAPIAADVAWAEAVLAEAVGKPGAFSFRGAMIDAPVLTRARRIIDRKPA